MSTSRQLIDRREAVSPFFVGVDLGGQSVKIGVVDDRGRSLSWNQIATECPLGPESGAQRMSAAVHRAILEARLEPSEIATVGLGSPGTMDIPAGLLLDPPNLPGWNDFPIRDRLSHHCGLPVVFANDANAAAFGEYWIGSGRDLHSMVMLTLGTGVGCGIIVNEQLIDGENSHGAECGHIIIDCRDDARVCSCGQPGHLEAYASALAVVRRTQDALNSGRASSLASRVTENEALSPLMIADEAERGDELSLEIVLETARYLGIGIVTLIHTIDPSGVVLGGAMTFGKDQSELGRKFLDRVKQEVARRAFPVLAERVRIEYASLGADAGYIGAAGVARQASKRTTTTKVD